MNINENVSFNAQVTVKDSNGAEVPVMYLTSALDAGNQNLNINVSTTNKILVKNNADIVKTQYAEFEAAVKARAKELGYVLF